jgi:four helix bundle protein
MHNYKNLKVWQKGMIVCEKTYAHTKTFPSDEKYGIIQQLRRCAVSIASNIAEGTSRKSQKEFAHFLSISLGSCFELETQLEISKRLNYINENDHQSIFEELEEVQKMLIAFIQKINSK